MEGGYENEGQRPLEVTGIISAITNEMGEQHPLGALSPKQEEYEIASTNSYADVVKRNLDPQKYISMKTLNLADTKHSTNYHEKLSHNIQKSMSPGEKRNGVQTNGKDKDDSGKKQQGRKKVI